MRAVARLFQGEGTNVRRATKLDKNMACGDCDNGGEVDEENSQPQRMGNMSQVENGGACQFDAPLLRKYKGQEGPCRGQTNWSAGGNPIQQVSP